MTAVDVLVETAMALEVSEHRRSQRFNDFHSKKPGAMHAQH